MSTLRTRIRTWRIAGGLVAAGVIAICAVLGLAGPASALTVSGDWYGYVVTGATYTSTTADWTMPAVSCAISGTYVSIWTGLDGYSSDSVEAASRRNSSLMSKGTYVVRVPNRRSASSSTRVFSQAPAPSSTNVSAFESSAMVDACSCNNLRSARVG